MDVQTIEFNHVFQQKPGTSGLRMPVDIFKQTHYLESYLQAIFNVMAPNQKKTLLLGSDGRYFTAEALQIAICMAVANGFEKVLIGEQGYFSTPAMANAITTYQAQLGVLFTASHNPGGPGKDFGVKVNGTTGAQPTEKQNQAIFAETKRLKEYFIVDDANINLSEKSSITIRGTYIEVIDPFSAYIKLYEKIFDFDQLATALTSQKINLQVDCMNGISGPYAKKLFEETLGAPIGTVKNHKPLPDFGGQAPDPSYTYARTACADGKHLVGVLDGDGDRALIGSADVMLGSSDALALMVEHHQLLPQFKHGIAGVARSFPTSRAVDTVAKAFNIPVYETPTGWKFFGQLLDEGIVSLCGEESFGCGADHLKEKDGIWVILCWLSILVATDAPLKALLSRHWQQFGRYDYIRFDFKNIPNQLASDYLTHLLDSQNQLAYPLKAFDYVDPITQTKYEKQCYEMTMDKTLRTFLRFSGTDTGGKTLRLYMQKYLAPGTEAQFGLDAFTEKLGQLRQALRADFFTIPEPDTTLYAG